MEGNMMLVYGEAETGKTTLAIQCAANCARMGYKTIFIDCEDTFAPSRMAHIAPDFEVLAPQIILMKPEDFRQQSLVIDRLNEYISERVGLVVVDTITGLYRERLGDMKSTFALNRELNRQLASLAQTTKTRKLASLVISQVRSVVLEEQEQVQPVAMRVLYFWADMILVLKPTAHAHVIKVSIEKRTEKKSRRPVFLSIEENGLQDYKR